MTNPDGLFSALGEEVARQVDELAGDDRPGEGYLAQAGRLMAARAQAAELVLRECVLLAPVDAGEQDDEEASGGELPLVVDRSHPSWTEVDAQQQERTGSLADGEGL